MSEFVAHTAWAARRSNVPFTGFYRENAICLNAGGRSVYPDASFMLVTKEKRVSNDEKRFRFFIEIDHGTERVRSQKETESIERKLRTYDAFQDLYPNDRFRVLFVSANNSSARICNILEAAANVVRHPNRTLVYGLTLVNYLTTLFSVTAPIFLDHRGTKHSLIPDIEPTSLLIHRVLPTERVTC